MVCEFGDCSEEATHDLSFCRPSAGLWTVEPSLAGGLSLWSEDGDELAAICSPSEASLISAVLRVMSLLKRGLKCGFFDHARIFKEDVELAIATYA